MSKPVDQERELFNREYEAICNRPITQRDIAWRMWQARAAVQPAGVAVPGCDICHGTLRVKEPVCEEGDCTRCLTASPHPASGEQKPAAYLHQVVQGDCEPDQALSFEPDSFPLSEALGFRSIACEALYKSQTAAQDVAGLVAEVERISQDYDFSGPGCDAELAITEMREALVEALAAHRAQQVEQQS